MISLLIGPHCTQSGLIMNCDFAREVLCTHGTLSYELFNNALFANKQCQKWDTEMILKMRMHEPLFDDPNLQRNHQIKTRLLPD